MVDNDCFMKLKRTLIAIYMVALTGVVCAQNNYQFPNPDFENWSKVTGKGGDVPAQWHTFSAMKCDLPWYAAIGCPVAKNNHSNRVQGVSGYAVELFPKMVAGTLANGAMTTGQTRVKDMNPGGRENYNFDPEGYRWHFNGRPDSIAFYAKSNGGMEGKAFFKVFLHDNNTFIDHANDDLTGNCYGQMIIAFHPVSSWKRFVKAVTYKSDKTPQLLLGSFSTNRLAGKGSASDRLALDKIRCVYDKKLSSLEVNGQAQESLLMAFNAAEALTHDGLTDDGTNSGVCILEFPITQSEQLAGAYPVVTATPYSALVRDCRVEQADRNHPFATITVEHNDGSTFVYTLNFVTSPFFAMTNVTR